MDFGLSRFHQEIGKLSHSFIGTTGYVSPETLAGKGHNYLTDAYTLGVFIYDMLHGGLPIRNIKMKLYEESTVVELHNNIKFREDLSMEAQDLILRLLSTDPNNRLLGDTEIKALLYHPWLKKYRLLDHSATAPEPLYIPDLSLPNFDSSFNAQFQPFVSELEGTET